MDEVHVDAIADPDLDDPVLVEGLPGVGQVGKLAVEHLLEEFESEPVRRVHSEHFPPQVTVEDGVAELASVGFHAIETDGRDLLVLAGDYQAGGSVGHYRVVEAFLDVAEAFGVSEVVTLGGVPTGEMPEEYAVVGAVSEAGHRERFEEAGVDFDTEEPAGGIVGTSGLLVGLGARRGLTATCLLGETSGYVVDPSSAKAVLEVLERVLDVEVDFTELEERAEQLEEFISQFQENQGQGQGPQAPGDEDLRYFG